MTITQKFFGQTTGGDTVTCYTLDNHKGLCAEILNYGATLRALFIHGRDVVLGFDTLSSYVAHDKYMGAVVGRVANRIGQGRFTLSGQAYTLPINNGPNCNHGGLEGFDRKLWQTVSTTENSLTLSYTSVHGEEGFPGTLTVTVTYALTDNNTLSLQYSATTDAPTLVNLTNHSYFNLKGQGNGRILDHTLRIPCNEILENDATSLPTGKRLTVTNTPFDFRTPRTIGSSIDADDYQIAYGNGYDHNYILADPTDTTHPLRLFCELSVPDLTLKAYTTQPGFQLYTGNFFDGDLGKKGAVYNARTGVALEAQNWPDAINHPDFPSSILYPGELYTAQTLYAFQ